MEGAPDPKVLHPVSGQQRVVFLKPLVTDPSIEVGDFTYYDDPDDALAFEQRGGAVRLRSRAAHHRALLRDRRRPSASSCPAPTTPTSARRRFPFGIFGEPWAEPTMDLVMGAPSRGDTVVGHDVWLGYRALVLPGVTIGHGAVVAAASVVAAGRSALRDRRRQPRPGRSSAASRTTTSTACCAPPGGTGPSSWSPSTPGRSCPARRRTSSGSRALIGEPEHLHRSRQVGRGAHRDRQPAGVRHRRVLPSPALLDQPVTNGAR